MLRTLQDHYFLTSLHRPPDNDRYVSHAPSDPRKVLIVFPRHRTSHSLAI